MKSASKLTAAALLAVVLTAQLASCGNTDSDKPAGTVTAENTAAQTAAVTESSAETEPALLPELPELDCGGTVYDILAAGNWGPDWTEAYDFKAEEQNGEPINDAVFARNLKVEERFHIKINEINYMGEGGPGSTGKGARFIKKSVMASDNAYDASMMGAYDVSSLAYTGYITDLYDVPYIDLSKPWWDQKANEDLTIRGKMYYSTGDISTLDNDCTFCILFNKKMAAELFDEKDNPYELVRSGKWTIDRFIEMASVGSKDLNGDSKFDKNDRYGFAVWSDSMMGMVNAAGEKFCTLTPEGNLESTLKTERAETMISKYMELAFDRTKAYSYSHSGDYVQPMFANDQIMFYTRYLNIIKKFRNMETDFGILPYPKFDENQERYYSTVAPYGCAFICVPSVVENLEMTGAVLEALAYESVDTVTPAYYDITLEGKMIRDNESAEMLDIILGNRVFDLGLFYQIGHYNTQIMNLFVNSKKEFASMCDRYSKNAQKSLDKINEAFAAVDD